MLDTGLPTLIVTGLADKMTFFVIPYDRHRSVFDTLSRSSGERKFYISEESGEYYLSGKGVVSPLPLSPYLDAFWLFR